MSDNSLSLPGGIALLSFYLIIIGILALLLLLYSIAVQDLTISGDTYIIAKSFFLCNVLIIIGFGMRSKSGKWAWFLGCLLILYSCLIKIVVFVTSYTIQCNFLFLIYLYLFKDNVLLYFGLSEQNKLQLMFIQLNLCLVFYPIDTLVFGSNYIPVNNIIHP